jgi:ribonucleoside-diphosphate reductase alpha chain
MSTMLKDIITAYKYGMKQLYYFNTYDGAGDDIAEKEVIHLEIPDIKEEECDSCTI